MSSERDEPLKRAPLNRVDSTKWPDGVRPIALDELDALGINRDGIFHWNGHPVVIQKGIALTRWQSIGTLLIVVLTVIGGAGAAAQGWAAAHQWSRQIKLTELACPPFVATQN